MIYQIVAVFDNALNCFGRPFHVLSTRQAVRSFTDEVNRKSPDNEMARHPEDYVLWHIGRFDDQEGQFLPHTPARLCTALEVYAKES